MASVHQDVKQFSSKVAYPTIVMTIVAVAVYVMISIAVIQGAIHYGWAILINSIMAYLLFTSMHEAGHLNISGKHTSLRWIDEIIGWVSGIPLLAPFYTFRTIHFRHHAFTNDPEKDPDHWLASKNFFALLFHSTTIFPVYLIKGLQLLLFEPKIPRKVKKDLRIGYVGLAVIVMMIVGLSMIIGWGMVLKIWILPAIVAQIFLAITFDWLPHHPHEERDRYQNTRIIDIPGLNLFMLGQNYHLIHHLYPKIPFYNYKEFYHEHQDTFKEKGTEIIEVGKNQNATTTEQPKTF
ncbi:MAG: fatty acid desaturase [Bacteroidia bacterium]|nr:fatty acid desaturase [Bacteroidia bacterium]